MSQEQAHHINQIMEIIAVIDGESRKASVCEDDKIGKTMEIICQKMEYQLKSNNFFMCGGIVLNPGFTFGFYKTQLFTQDNKIRVMVKVSIQKYAADAKVAYSMWELNRLIKTLKKVRSEVVKEGMREQASWERYQANRGVRSLNRLLKEKAEQQQKSDNSDSDETITIDVE